MSCGTEFLTSNCVCDTLLAIVEAQDRVDPSCTSSCNRAIQELVGGVSPVNGNTIPVILSCKSTCQPYVGVGAIRVGTGPVLAAPVTPPTSGFYFITSGVFRVVEVDPETCCATLELLDGSVVSGAASNPFAVLATNMENPLVSSGACITVDLNCFCSVTCLSPIHL